MNMKELKLNPGDILFSENDIDEKIYILNKGLLEEYIEKGSKHATLNIY
jgi:CRP-like cAMP-binding protein